MIESIIVDKYRINAGIENGKFVFNALRNGEKWLDNLSVVDGSNMILAMFYRIQELENNQNEKEIPKGSRNPFCDNSIACVCGNDVDVDDGEDYCKWCGQKLDLDCLNDAIETFTETIGNKTYTFVSEDDDSWDL